MIENEILKKCLIHGELNRTQLIKAGRNGFACQQCESARKKKAYKKILTDDEINQKLKNKICATHGPLNRNNIILEGSKICCHQCKLESGFRTREKYKAKYAKTYNEKRREKVNFLLKEKRKNNLDEFRQYGRDKYAANKEKITMQKACRMAGITIDEYCLMIEVQENKCAICNEYETRKSSKTNEITRLCIDHDHKTGKVRGLLCVNCNSAIGKLKDDIIRLQSAIDYLKKHKDKLYVRKSAKSNAGNAASSAKACWRQ